MPFELVARNGLIALNNSIVTGSLNVTNGITGSLLGTSSLAVQALTASSADAFNVRGTLTATTLVVQTITSSQNFITGSTRFGTIITNTHQFTGSVGVTGSITVIDGVTNNLTASWSNRAISASIADNAVTASRALNANTASHAAFAATATSATTATSVVATVTGTNSTELVRGNMADNDQFRILVGGTSTNAGFVEIATADDGTEPIHVRQYTGVFSTLTRTATLLDGSGNTSFPGNVTASSGFEIPNSQFYKARRSSGNLLTDMIGIPSGTDDVRILTTGDFNVINGSLTNILAVKNGGSIGIGTTSPATNLHIVSSTNTGLRINATGANGSAELDLLSNGTQNAFVDYGPNQLRFRSTNSDMSAIVNGSVLVLQNDGNVGIGTTAPIPYTGGANVLHVHSSGVTDIKITNTSTGTSATAGGLIRQDGNDMFVWNGSSGVIGFGTANQYRMQIAANGNVGIGTTSPAATLHVVGTGRFSSSLTMLSGTLRVSGSSSSRLVAESDYSGGNVGLSLFNTSGTEVIWLNAANGSINGTGPAYFGGNVGIGTTNPAGQLSGTIGLSIVNATNAALGLSNGTNHWLNYLSGTTYRIWNNSVSEVVTILLNGNVGIGTTSPAYRLDVAGTGRFSGNVLISKSNDATVEVNSTTSASYSAFFHSESGVAKAYWEYVNSTFSDSTRRNYLEAFNSVGGFSVYTAGAKRLDIASTGAATFSSSVTAGAQMSATYYRVSNSNGVSGYLIPQATWLGSGTATNLLIAAEGGNSIGFMTNGTTDFRMFINTSGNVGIGTTSPNFIFQARQTTNANFYIGAAVNVANAITIGGVNDAANANIPIEVRYATTFALVDTGTTRVTVASGNVGIGTTAPIYALDAYSTGASTARLRVVGTTNFALTQAQNTSGVLYMGIDSSTADGFNVGNYSRIIWSSAAYPLVIAVNDAERMRITSGGNVGIGTTSPTAKIDTYGVRIGRDFSITNRATVRLDSNGTGNPADILFGHTAAANETSWTGVYWSVSSRGESDNNRFYIYRGGGNPGGSGEAVIMALQPDGNVGIGTTSPGAKLHIANGSLGLNGTDPNFPFFVTDTSTGTNRYNLANKGMGFNLADDYAQLQLFGANGGYIDFTNAAEDFDARIIYFAGSSFQFSYGTTMTLNSTGVGIGTTSPTSNLDISGAGTVVGKVRTSSNSGAALFTTVNDIGTTNEIGCWGSTRSGFGAIQPNNGYVFSASDLAIGATSDLKFGTGASNTERMRITSGGAIGIGTTSPAGSFQVHINRAGNTGLFISNTSGNCGGYLFAGGLDGLEIQSVDSANSAAKRLLLQPYGGNVGIGTTSPDGKLHVYNSATTGGIRVGGGNGSGNSRIFIEAAGNNSYIDSYGDSAYKPLQINASTLSFNGGDVGIGTTSPSRKLDVLGNTRVYGSSGNDVTFTLQSQGSSAPYLILNGSLTSYNLLRFQHAGTDYAGIGAFNADITSALSFYTNGISSERMRITSGGQVGINTTSPLNTAWGDSSNTKQLSIYGSNYAVINLEGALGGARKFSMGVGDNIFYMCYDNTAGRHNITVNSSGNVGINDTTPSYRLDVDGDIRATGDVIAFSDARVKDNVQTVENALSTITSMRGVTYTRKDNEDKSRKVGVIAQEVLPILPEVVQQDAEGNYSVAYGNMVGVLIEAIKEQQKQIDELKYLLQNK
jgi:hypothetical protein